jgi:hypothetical protein
MFSNFLPNIPKGSKVIVGLGDSFTQGVGSWSSETYKKYGDRINIHNIPPELIQEMYDNSWVSQLCKNHMPEYIPVNFGKMGTGNRSAVKQLYLNPSVKLENASKVIVVLMLSGIERFDFVNKDFPEHFHFYTMWPNPQDKNATNPKLWKIYAKDLWSEKFVAVEAILNILDAYTFCKAHGYDFIVTSAFDQRISRKYFSSVLEKRDSELINTVPWDKFLYPRKKKSFIELLTGLDGKPFLADGGFFPYYTRLSAPSTYITNCAHPSMLGHKVIAECIFDFIKELDK